MSIEGVFSQIALNQINLGFKILKADAEADKQLVDLIAGAVAQGKVTATRGQNINIKV